MKWDGKGIRVVKNGIRLGTDVISQWEPNDR